MFEAEKITRIGWEETVKKPDGRERTVKDGRGR